MKKSAVYVICYFIAGITAVCFSQNIPVNPDIEQKIDDMLGRMRIDEKIGQMTQLSGAGPHIEGLVRGGKIGSLLNIRGASEVNRLQRIAVQETRLGIPLIIGNDVIHGYRTVYPIPLGCAASWDTMLIRQVSEMAAGEAAAAGTHWTFAPMVDIARDPRWGRIAEGNGEDPFLGSAIAHSAVNGFQGKNLADPLTILACPKHYVAYGAAEGGRDYNTTEVSERTLREIYLPPFKAAINAGAGSIMSAFNDLNGIPASANSFTLREVLKSEWRFQGFVVSDWSSIAELISHGIAGNNVEAGVAALKAGVDMDMEGYAYGSELEVLVKEGKVPVALVDEAVRRILRMKYCLGLFEHPYIDETLAGKIILSEQNIALALQMARESIVLLKNSKNVLPLDKNLKTLAVIGPLADDQDALLGTWSCEGQAGDVISVLKGVQAAVDKNTKVVYRKGCEIDSDKSSGIEEAVAAARGADAVILVLGESREMSGEAASRSNLDLPGMQNELARSVIAAGKPTVVVLIDGRPLMIADLHKNASAILECWAPGIQGGRAIADVIFGDYNPSGKLPVTFPLVVGQVPIYYNHKNTGRPGDANIKFTSKYRDLSLEPLYPFGYGLSYTTFKYSDLKVVNNKLLPNDVLKVQVNLENTDKRSGTEVAQVYLRDPVASVTRPVKELKGFKRVDLQPGEKKTITFEIPVREMGFYNQALKYVIEPGVFDIMVGGSSEDLLKTSFEVIGVPPK
ncbi:MAG: glycoside hydrolase family 3 N-terminal domain-containing protein [Candidatus Neomarinimicrobiota bacterium]